jgi:hypothetical protein
MRMQRHGGRPFLAVGGILLCIAVSATVIAVSQPAETRDCETQFMSLTVVATACTHGANGQRVLDLLVMWRGAPGWYQRNENGGQMKDVVRDFARGEPGRVAQFRTYSDITVGFDAHFDDQTVTIDGVGVSLISHNAIVVDDVDLPHARRIIKALRVEPALPERGETLFTIARRSREVRDSLQCEIHVPSVTEGPGSPVWHRPRVTTVCELLRR